ncbi:Ankyrin repeat-containing protein [Vitis vinifera]|uniref:Ankyrin repeat-containing protein n=1 Tax=Vitis vinifera TaxID=29760 RepID=A0A438CQL7_VITVI|nr:Ankyrin repeat-containing protein [Vitis vinifera]
MPLHEAVRNGHHSTVLVLVEANDSDLLVSLNNAGESPLFMAVDVRASEIVKTILPKSNPYSLLHRSSDGQTILHRAILRADLNYENYNPTYAGTGDEKDSCGRSPLHYAAASGALALVDHLLQLKPSNGSFLDNNLATPAHMAAENGHLNVLKLFVKRYRYWVELLNNHHQNILHVAAQNGHLKVVRYIQNMFMVNDLLNETDEDGNTLCILQQQNCTTASLFHQVMKEMKAQMESSPTTPNKTGCAATDHRNSEAASAKQAKKLEGILEQEDLIIESIRDKRLVMDVTCPNGTGIPYWTVHCSITLNGACYHGLFYCCLFPSLLYLLGPLILPEEFVWSLVDIVEKIKTKIHSFCLFHSTMLGSLHSTVLVLVEANDSDLLVSLNNAGESPLFMAVDARASEIMKTILPKSNPYSLSIEVPTARRFYTGPF